MQNNKHMSVPESRFGKSKRQTKKPWNPKATLWQHDTNVRLMARDKLAVLSNTAHVFWICWIEWSYSKATRQWTQNSSKTSEACVVPEEITSKAEFVEKRASENRENDTILHNFRQKQPGDWDSQVHIDYYPVIKRAGRAMNSEMRERGRIMSHLKNQMIWIMFLRLSHTSTTCFRQQIQKIRYISQKVGHSSFSGVKDAKYSTPFNLGQTCRRRRLH